MGVVHMNGRIYDPLVGRFMSADPFIQAPSMLQSYNRYAHVMNNPLNLTDPSGYWSLRGFLRGLDTFARNPSTTNAFNAHRGVPGVAAIDNFVVRNPWAFQIGRAAAGAWGGPWAAAGATGYYTYLTTGCESCSVKAFGLSLGTAYAFDAAGTAAQGSEYGVGHYASHAAVGCVSSVAGGGQCGAGALSAVAGLAGTQIGGAIGAGMGGRFASAVIAGGIGSRLAGGSFMDGAQTAAYGYLFNAMRHGTWADKYESLISSYEKSNPLETQMFKELLVSIPANVVGNDTMWASVIVTFEAIAKTTSQLYVAAGIGDFYPSVLGASRFDPRSWFDRISTPNDAKGVYDLPNLFREAVQMQSGPQIFNRSFYESAFGKPSHPWNAYPIRKKEK
jgi:hypothetical protein